jgi:iron complex transport system substrate-binding protein
MDENVISGIILDQCIKIHRDLGPGLLESVYEVVLAERLRRAEIRVESQKPVSFSFDGMVFDNGFRIDLLVEDCIVVELKSVEVLAPVHSKQVLTYLKLMNLHLGLLINFGAPTLKQGFHRILNGYIY